MNRWVDIWLDFCRDGSAVAESETEPLFMESLTDEELARIFSVFDNPSEFLKTFERSYCEDCVKLTFQERRTKVIDLSFSSASALGKAIRNGFDDQRFDIVRGDNFVVTENFEFLSRLQNSSRMAIDFVQSVGDLVFERLPQDRVSGAYYSACYYINNNLLLQDALALPLFVDHAGNDKDLIKGLETYLAVYSLGGLYAVMEEGLLIFMTDECPGPFWKNP